MRCRHALVNVTALLPVIRLYDVPGETVTDVPTARDVQALVLTTAAIQIRTSVRVMTAQLIRTVSAVIGKVAELRPIHALLVRTGKLREGVAGFLFRRAQCDVVLIGSIATIVHSVADLIPSDAPVIRTLESAQSVTVEVRTNRWGFIGVIAAIVGAVAEVRWRHAQVVIALVTRLWTIPSIREPRWAIHFIGHVSAISVAITPEVRSNAMSRSALERSILALESFAVQLVRVITAIVLVVATPTLGDALSVVAQELRFGALSVFALALRFGLIGTITAIISKIALPLSGEVEKLK